MKDKENRNRLEKFSQLSITRVFVRQKKEPLVGEEPKGWKKAKSVALALLPVQKTRRRYYETEQVCDGVPATGVPIPSGGNLSRTRGERFSIEGAA